MTADALTSPSGDGTNAPAVAVGLAGPVALPVRAPSLNLPNALTLGRLLVVPALAVLLLLVELTTGPRVLAWALFTAACVTDVVDGRLARSWGQVTRFGVMADPIADKTLVATALVGLSLLGEVPWWATTVVLGRELAVTGLRIAVLRHGLIPASRGGKAKALAQNLAVAAYLLPLGPVLAHVRAPLLWIAVGCTVVTGVDYAVQAFTLRRATRAPSAPVRSTLQRASPGGATPR